MEWELFLSQPRKKKTSSSRRQDTKFNKSGKESDALLERLDTLRTKVKKDHEKVSSDKSSTNRLITVVIIVVVGMSGIVVLIQMDLFQQNQVRPHPNTSFGPINLVKTGKSNFYQDLDANALFINNMVSFVYVGGEFCPICAMERWAIVMALSNYGNFSSPSFYNSSEGNIPTYDFTKISYSSSVVNFEKVEVSDQQTHSLEPLTGIPASLYEKYNSNQYIPFICIGGTFIQIGSGKSFNTASFSGLSSQQIESQIQSKNGPVYDQIQIESSIIVFFINQLLTQQSSSNNRII